MLLEAHGLVELVSACAHILRLVCVFHAGPMSFDSRQMRGIAGDNHRFEPGKFFRRGCLSMKIRATLARPAFRWRDLGEARAAVGAYVGGSCKRNTRGGD